MNLTKEQMAKDIIDSNLDIDTLNKLNIIIKSVKKNNKIKKEKPKKQIDKTTDKYKLALKLINKILLNIGVSEIDCLTKFQNIDREYIIKVENKIILDDMADKLFEHFDKKKCGYYRKTDYIVLNCLRGMMKELGLEMYIDKKTICKNTILKTHSFYSIN